MLNYKKPAFWLGVAAVVCCVIVAVCFLTDPPADPTEDAVLLGREPASDAGPEVSGEPAPVNSQEPVPPLPQTTVLTPENAQQTIQAILGTFRVVEDRTVTFSIPEVLPVSEDGKTELTITLNVTYISEPDTYSTNSLLDWETDWTAGQIYTADFISPHRGEAKRIMLRAAYMTHLDGNSFREYAANYVELTPPFPDVPVASIPMLEVVQSGREVTATYLLRGGNQFALSFTAPEGLTAAAEQPETVSAELFAPRVVLTDGAGNQAGILSLYPIDGIDLELWDRVDPAENHLPLQIFAWRAMGSHAGYDGYTVVRHSSSGASATARWWRDLLTPFYVGGVDEPVPQEWTDCVLAYDWSAALCFAEFMLGDGTLTPDQLTALAESVTFR